jgi:uncharacterized protein
MSLKQKIEADLREAMKSQEKQRVTTLRGLLSEIKQVEVDTRNIVDDEKIVSIIQKEVKKFKDALKFAQDASREDLIEKNKTELTIIQSYLGEQYSEEKLRELISAIIASGGDNIGKIMGMLNKEHKGKYEGKMASEIAKELLC